MAEGKKVPAGPFLIPIDSPAKLPDLRRQKRGLLHRYVPHQT